jgi:hypothetical protein
VYSRSSTGGSRFPVHSSFAPAITCSALHATVTVRVRLSLLHLFWPSHSGLGFLRPLRVLTVRPSPRPRPTAASSDHGSFGADQEAHTRRFALCALPSRLLLCLQGPSHRRRECCTSPVRWLTAPSAAPAQVIMNQVDPQKNKRKESKQKSKEALGKLGIDLATLDLSEHEEIIASEVVSADEIQVTFNGVWFFFSCPFHWPPKLLMLRPCPVPACRRRRSRSDHLPAQRSRHLPALLPAIVRELGRTLWRAKGSLALRSARLWKGEWWFTTKQGSFCSSYPSDTLMTQCCRPCWQR